MGDFLAVYSRGKTLTKVSVTSSQPAKTLRLDTVNLGFQWIKFRHTEALDHSRAYGKAL